MSAADILVTGARGKTGREVVGQLAARGIPVRAGSRTPGPPTATVHPVLFDWEDPATWGPAATGVTAIYLMRPDLEAAPDLVTALIALNPGAHVVLLSEQGAGGLPDASWERWVERAVTDSASTWTLLRPSWFHQVLTDSRFYFHAIRDDGVLPLSSGGATIAFVDARDIAAVAIAALTAPLGSDGATYTITGPAALPVSAVADLIAAAADRQMAVVDPPREEAVAGLSPWLTEVYSGVLDRVRTGVFGEVTEDVRRVTGAEPRSLELFVSEHADVWRDQAT